MPRVCGDCKYHQKGVNACSAPVPQAWVSYSSGFAGADDPQAEDCTFYTHSTTVSFRPGDLIG